MDCRGLGCRCRSVYGPPFMITWGPESGGMPPGPVPTYTVCCSHRVGRRFVSRDIARGLLWDDATRLVETLQRRDTELHPTRLTSWNARLYIRRREP